MEEDVWNDIGYRGPMKREEKEWRPLRIPLSPIPDHRHEPKESTEARRAKNHQAIFTILPTAQVKENGMILAQIPGARFEFHAASDTYVCHSMRKGTRYGTGIRKLCEQIAQVLSASVPLAQM